MLSCVQLAQRMVGKLRQSLLHVLPACRAERLVERDGVFHRELGAGADGKVRRRLGVADQHDVVHHPVLIRDPREITPQRTIDHQPVALQLFGKNFLEKFRRLLFS